MGLEDKMEHTGEKMKGQAKEAMGKMTDNEDLEARGRGDQAAADVKQAAEKAKDAAKDAFDRD
ncbi:MAG TPA: CsbD family protein [Nakamurella sp.]|jgi:uncharacterized protein YjbJ (UPF0337 family)|nr:CsbD family protein [Nakamurella sp.]